jgi:hypothetical protein
MGLMPFQPARKAEGSCEVRQMTPTASASITNGAPVQRNATDPEKIEEATGGATVTGIIGVAIAAAVSGTPEFGDTIPVAIASQDQEFLGQIWDVSGGVVALPVKATHEGVEFGVVEISTRWYVDEEDTTDHVVRVTKVFPEIYAVLFKFISTAIGE